MYISTAHLVDVTQNNPGPQHGELHRDFPSQGPPSTRDLGSDTSLPILSPLTDTFGLSLFVIIQNKVNISLPRAPPPPVIWC